jgi:SNF2-related domain/Helicase conserved C-terminal domain
MTETIIEKGRGTSIAPENLDEVLRASKNGGVGQSQFFTPLEFARLCAKPLPNDRPVITDMQAGTGQLLIGAANETTQMGLAMDIENCKMHWQEKWPRFETARIAGDCTSVFPLLKEVSGEFDCFALNPPWSLHWHKKNLAKLAESDLETVRQSFGGYDDSAGNDSLDSTIGTLMMALDLCSYRGEGFLIANDDTLQRLIFREGAPYALLATHIWGHVRLLSNPMTGEQKQTFDKSKDFFTGVIWFAQGHADGLCADADMQADNLTEFEDCVGRLRMGRHRFRSGSSVSSYNKCETSIDTWKAVRTEWETRNGKRRPDWNLWLDSEGTIVTYLSVFDGKSTKIPKQEAVSLFELNGKKVMELVMMRNTRQLLLKHLNGGIWRVHPDLGRQVDAAVKAYYAARAPLLPLNDIQRLGYCDESEMLECKADLSLNNPGRLETMAEKIVKEIRANGLRLNHQAAKGKYGLNELSIGPKSKVPKELEQTIREHKDEIIEFLETESQHKGFDGVLFRAGKSYQLRTQTVTVSRTVERPGMDGEDHELYYKGQELLIWLKGENGKDYCFVDRRHSAEGVEIVGEVENEGDSGYKWKSETTMHADFDLQTLVAHMIVPAAPDVGICNAPGYQANLKFIDGLEAMIGNGFRAKGFQRRDLARAALHDGLILACSPGGGKTMMGIVYGLLKVGLHSQANGLLLPAKPILIVCPEGLWDQMEQDYKDLFGAAMPSVTRLEDQTHFLELAPLKPGWYFSSFTRIASNKIAKMPELPEEGAEIDDEALADLMKFLKITVADAVAYKAYGPRDHDDSTPQQAPRSGPRMLCQSSEENEITLDRLIQMLDRAGNPEDIFGELDTEMITAMYRRLAKIAHPDAVGEADKARATEAFKQLTVWYDRAQQGGGGRRLLSVHARALALCRKRHAEWSEGCGMENAQGIKCVYSPSLADLVRHQFECVIIDEAVRIKAEDSIIGVGVRSLDPKYRLVLTGTPIKNRLPDIFFLAAWACDALDAANARWPYHGNKPGEIERFAEEFLVMARDLTKERKEAEARGGRFVPPSEDNRRKQRRGKPTAEVCNVHRLWKLLAPVVLRRLKKDFGEDIVPKVKRPIYVPMGTEQAKVYAYHLQANYIDKNGMPAIGAQLQALRNCAAAPHTDLLEDKGDYEVDGVKQPWKSGKDYIPKLHACLEIVEEVLRRREQVVIFSPFHEPLDTMSKYLKQAGVPHDVLDGRMTAQARGRLAMEFKKGLPSAKPVLLAGMKACSEGNSWDKANNVILFSFDWALDLFLQAIDRVHRLNSKKPVNIYPIICRNTIDRKLESLLDEKDDSSELVLDGQLMNETIEEVSLATLLKIAHAEFTADKAMDEDLCIEQWPVLRDRLSEAVQLLSGVTVEQQVQQEAKATVVETLMAPVEKIMEFTQEPRWLNWSRRFRFT